MRDDRYQYQCRVVQVFRWLRWRPWYAILAIIAILHWLCRGYAPEEKAWFATRSNCIKWIWTSHLSLASCRMKHYYAIDELISNLKNEND